MLVHCLYMIWIISTACWGSGNHHYGRDHTEWIRNNCAIISVFHSIWFGISHYIWQPAVTFEFHRLVSLYVRSNIYAKGCFIKCCCACYRGPPFNLQYLKEVKKKKKKRIWKSQSNVFHGRRKKKLSKPRSKTHTLFTLLWIITFLCWGL